MQRSRSFVRLVLPSCVALLFVWNCTVKVENNDGVGGSASGGAANTSGGATTGGADVTKGGSTSGGSATTSGGSATTSGGSSNAGAGGVPNAQGGAAGASDAGGGGMGGAGGATSLDACEDCLLANCAAELEACLDDVRCYNDDPNFPGQYQDMVVCMEGERESKSLTRADVVDCGIAIARSQNSTSDAWPPDDMAITTTDLINCMATGETNKPNNSGWSDGDRDVPTDPISQKWAPNSCAKTSCTSQL
ncbi:MAG: hypothetical protein ACOY0T_21930 [Myxococcota bacterium]